MWTFGEDTLSHRCGSGVTLRGDNRGSRPLEPAWHGVCITMGTELDFLRVPHLTPRRQDHTMQFSLTRLALPAVLALSMLAPSATANPGKVDLGISFSNHGGLDVRIGSSRYPRTRRRTSRITPSRGYWKTITEQVWVPGCSHREWVPACYETVYDSRGNAHRVLVQEGHYRTVQDPGHYEARTRRMWVPARRRITPGRRCR